MVYRIVLEVGELLEEAKFHRARGAVSLVLDDDFGEILFVGVGIIEFVPIEEDD